MRWLVCGFVLAGACARAPAGQTAPMPVPSDAELQHLLTYSTYKQSGFAKLNRSAYPSTLAQGSEINVYVTSQVLDLYEKIDPDTHGTMVELPAGTTIVREVVDAMGRVAKLTLMARHPGGWFPDGGDWMFAATNPIGEPLTDTHGAAEWGPLETCGTCHAQRANDSWVFGVSKTAR